MVKIDLGQLVVDSYRQDEVISWLSLKSNKIVKSIDDAILANSMGEVGVVRADLEILSNTLRALNENINGKKTAVVV